MTIAVTIDRLQKTIATAEVTRPAPSSIPICRHQWRRSSWNGNIPGFRFRSGNFPFAMPRHDLVLAGLNIRATQCHAQR